MVKIAIKLEGTNGVIMAMLGLGESTGLSWKVDVIDYYVMDSGVIAWICNSMVCF